MSGQSITVIGAGAWGTALAEVAALGGNWISLRTRDPGLANTINETQENPAYLPGATLSGAITARAGFAEIGDPDLVLLATPAQASRAALEEIGAKTLAGKPVVLCAKGIETRTLLTQSQILADIAPNAIPLVLSGPSFAADVVAGRPTAVTLAGADPEQTGEIAQTLSGPSLRLYASDDIVGVELAGALKNIYALAAGAVEGAGLGLSARSALIARAQVEMRRLILEMGGKVETLSGLAGLGDLVLSCTTPQSRNYRFGLALGQGRTVAEIEADGAPLAEGVATAPVAFALADDYGVDMPLIEAVTLLLDNEKAIADIVATLMARPLKRET